MVLQVLVQVYPRVSVIEDGISVGHDRIIRLRAVLTLPLRDVAVGDVTLRPDGGGVAGELVIQRNAEEAGGGKTSPTGERGRVVGLIGRTSAISTVIYPIVEGTSRDDTSSSIISILIQTSQRIQGIFLSGKASGYIHVYTLLVHAHSIDPSADLGGSGSEVDVGRFGSITHVQVTVDLRIEKTHRLYLIFEIKGSSDTAISKEASGHLGKDAVKACRLGGLRKGIKRCLTS